MSKKLSFAIAINLLTENFKKGANNVKNYFRSMQMQIITFAAALGAGGLGLSGLVSRFRDVARETSRVLTALKNVSGGTKGFADNLRFTNDLANKYGIEINGLIGSFVKFTASATQANMPMAEQKKVFESVSHAISAFNLSSDESKGVMLALSQMMGKGKISSEELRKQMGEKLPVAMQAMAKAAGVSMAGLETLLKQGKLMSADILPKFADALNEIVPNVDTDNLETSINRLSNAFNKIINSSGFQNKYKALIDWLTDALQTAGKNIQNILIGIVAAIAFVLTNSFSKILKGWWSLASELTTGQKKLAMEKLRTESERAAAEKALDKAHEEYRIKWAGATAKAKTELNNKVLLAQEKYYAAVEAADKADIAHAKANASKKTGYITKSFNTIKVGVAKLAASLKSMWNAFAPSIIFSALTALTMHIIKAYNATKKLEKLTEDYNADVEKERININILFNRLRNATEGTEKYNKAKNEILNKYGEYLQGLSDEIKSLQDVEGAYKAISKAALQAAKDRAIERGTNEATDNYMETYKLHASRLKKELNSSFGKEKGTELFDEIIEEIANGENLGKEVQTAISQLTKTYTVPTGRGASSINTINAAETAIMHIKRAKANLDKEIEDITSIFGTASNKTDEDNTTPKTSNVEIDDKALRAAEKRLEALRKLDEADRQRQIDKQKFDLDMQQKAIDLMDDSFEKRTKQTLLNLEKEKLSIEEAQSELLQKQLEYAKNQFISVKGTDKGFEAYFAELQKNSFKDENGMDILPEGLRPEDIAERVRQMLNAARAAQRQGLADINREASELLNEQRLLFASRLEQQLADINKHYNERIKAAKGNADLIAQYETNRNKEIKSAQLQTEQQRLEAVADYNQRYKELVSDRYVFESDKQRDLLKQQIADQQKIYFNLSHQFLNDPDNDELANQLRNAYLQLQLLNKELQKTPTQKLKEIVGIINQIGNELSNITGVDFSPLSESLSGILAFAEQDYLGAAISGISLISKALGGLLGQNEEHAQIKREIVKLQQQYNIDLRQQNYELISSIDYARAFRDNMEALHWLVEKGFISDVDYSAWEALNERVKEANKNIKEAQNNQDKLEEGSANILNEIANIGTSYLQEIWGSIAKDWQKGTISVEEAFRRLAAAGMDGANDIADRIANASAETEKWTNELVELVQQMDEFVTGTSFDSFLSDAASALKEFRNDITQLADFTEDALTDAILSSFKYQILASALKPMYDELANMFLSGDFDSSKADEWKQNLNEILNEKGKELDALFESFGIDPDKDSTNQTASSKGFQSMDQDTGNRLDGRFAALQMSGIKIEGLLSAISFDTKNMFSNSISVHSELKKHSELFNDMKTIQLNTFYEIEGTNKSLKGISSMLDKIDKNTSNL